MNPLLAQLKDIHLPPPITQWPIAVGWIFLYFLLVSGLVYFFYYTHQKKKKYYPIRYALNELNSLQALMEKNPAINIAEKISILIRRTALYYYDRHLIAGLSGEKWLHFLNESGQTKNFTTPAGLILIDAPYRKHYQTDLTALFSITENWLKVLIHQNKKEN